MEDSADHFSANEAPLFDPFKSLFEGSERKTESSSGSRGPSWSGVLLMNTMPGDSSFAPFTEDASVIEEKINQERISQQTSRHTPGHDDGGRFLTVPDTIPAPDPPADATFDFDEDIFDLGTPRTSCDAAQVPALAPAATQPPKQPAAAASGHADTEAGAASIRQEQAEDGWSLTAGLCRTQTPQHVSVGPSQTSCAARPHTTGLGGSGDAGVQQPPTANTPATVAGANALFEDTWSQLDCMEEEDAKKWEMPSFTQLGESGDAAFGDEDWDSEITLWD